MEEQTNENKHDEKQSATSKTDKNVKKQISQEQAADATIQDEEASTDAPQNQNDQSTNLSKNQMRKKRRLERMKELNAKRKQQKKEARYAKALAEGRDIEAERLEQEIRRQSGEGNKRRLLAEKQRFENVDKSFGVCLDCSYEDQMTEKEISSLALQVRYCYASNKRSKNPCRLFISSLSGKTYEHLSKVNGFPDQWKERAFINTEEHFIKYWKEDDIKKLVYLTSDSENVVETIEDDKIYIIGGIVDRNRLKHAAFAQAQLHSVSTAKLPISNYIKTNATKVLTCNHVFEILLKYKEYGNDWEKALMDVLPQRKGLSTVKVGDNDEVEIQDGEKDEDNKEVDDLERKDLSLEN